MADLVTLLLPDGSPVSDEPWGPLEAGQDSAVLSLDLWHRRGETGGDPLRDVLVVLAVEAPGESGRVLTEGVAPLDQLWVRARVAGQTADTDGTQADHTSAWQSLGAGRALTVPAVHVGNARHLELICKPPSSAQAVTYRWHLLVFHSEHARGLPVTGLPAGVLTGIGDPGSGLRLVRGGGLVPSSPPDHRLHVPARTVLERGLLRGELSEELPFDAFDGDGLAVADGGSYRVRITQTSAGVSAYRSAQGLGEPAPPAPAGEVSWGTATVSVVSGAVVIEADDIDSGPIYDRLHATPGDGAELVVHAGQARTGNTHRYWDRTEPVPVPADDTVTVWQVSTGRYTTTPYASPADAVPPTDSALPLWRVSTVATVVTELVDLRPIGDRQHVLRLVGTPTAAGVAFASALVDLRGLQVDRVVARVRTPGTATAGQSVVDIHVAGATLYPGSASDDQRPSFPGSGTGAELRTDGHPELRSLPHLALVELVAAELPTGGTAPEVEVLLLCLY